jgi:hypothetical protein
MTTRPAGRASRSRRRAAGAAVLLLGAIALPACAEVESPTVEGYEPAKLEAVKGEPGVKQVRFTAEGARRTGLKTAAVDRRGERQVVPYAALLYDAEGRTYVYTSPRPLTYLRRAVTVDRIDAGRVYLSKGPRAGTDVVTVGAAEVYGTELEVGSGH